MSETRLSGLLCSKLCHDLVGPIGAIGNGIELLAEETDADMKAQAVDLLAHSAGHASGRLKFYRLAFGLAGDGQALSLAEAADAARGLFADGKVTVDWPAPEGGAREAPKALTRAVLNLVVLAGGSLMRGGKIDVTLTASGARVSAGGSRPTLDPEIAATLAGVRALDQIGPREAPAYLARQLANEAGLSIAVEEDENGVVFSLA